jgi:hypothetical protein
LRSVNHRNEHPQNLVVRLAQKINAITLEIAARHRKFDPVLCLSSFAFRVGQLGDESRLIAELPPRFGQVRTETDRDDRRI